MSLFEWSGEKASDAIRFTPRAQQALSIARLEAIRFNHNFVGTEHVLLGLLKLNQGFGIRIFFEWGVTLETIGPLVERSIKLGAEPSPDRIPYTPRMKNVLATAAKEAKTLGHIYIGTEHIILGLLQENEGLAARILKELGLESAKAREKILDALILMSQRDKESE